MKILSSGNIKGVVGKDIFVCKKTTPEIIEKILKSKAVIVEEGNLLSHASIICRELKIPCVQIDNAMSIFKKGMRIVGLNWIYGEVINDIDSFVQKYRDFNFKATREDNNFLDKILKIMIKNITTCDFLSGAEWKEWRERIKSPINFYKKAKTPVEKMTAISWIDKIIRATTI